MASTGTKRRRRRRRRPFTPTAAAILSSSIEQRRKSPATTSKARATEPRFCSGSRTPCRADSIPIAICSATQDRQDAVIALLAEQPLDLMVVIGGYNSSNTYNLARICEEKLPTYHIAEPEGIVSRREIRHKPVGTKQEVTTAEWLPAN